MLGAMILIQATHSNAQLPQLQWTGWIPTNLTAVCNAVATDASGHLYSVGYFSGTADLDPGSGLQSVTSAGNFDIFIQKSDAAGQLIWHQAIGGTGQDRGNSIAVDDSGNVYVVGMFSANVDFDPGGSGHTKQVNGIADIFLLKLDPNGNFLWVRTFGGAEQDAGFSVTFDPIGNVLITGNFGETVDFDPGPGNIVLTSKGGIDAFVVKLDPAGKVIWAKSFGGSRDESGFSVKTDSKYRVYISGGFVGEVDFDPGPGQFNVTPTSFVAGYVLQLEYNGIFGEVSVFDGVNSTYCSANKIAIGPNDEIFTVGNFRGMIDFDPDTGTTNRTSLDYTEDYFVHKMDSMGEVTWVQTWEGKGDEFGQSIALGDNGALYIAGSFSDTMDFDMGPGTQMLATHGAADIFIQKLDASGNSVWAGGLGGKLLDYPASITTGPIDAVYLSGSFQDTIDCDPGTGETILLGLGERDGLILKFSNFGVGIDESASSTGPVFYPNPTNGQINISAENWSTPVNLTIRNATGQIVDQRKWDPSGVTTIDLIGPAGLYFVQITHDEGQSVAKVLKH